MDQETRIPAANMVIMLMMALAMWGLIYLVGTGLWPRVAPPIVAREDAPDLFTISARRHAKAPIAHSNIRHKRQRSLPLVARVFRDRTSVN